MKDLDTLKQLYSHYKEQGLKDYCTFLSFPSISTDPAYRSQVTSCADWVCHYLKNIGFDVELWPTTGHPIVFAKNMRAGPTQPTLLIYNHYDVQPVDPLEEWKSPPFEPTIHGEEIFARGAQDNKGQCLYVLLALKALMEKYGSLPINVKLCIEGEEEAGSTGLSSILASKPKALQADHLAVVDLGLRSASEPAISLGVRGLVTMDVEVSCTHTDLHSGFHGGLAYNPIHALTELLAMVRHPSGAISIPGFYDDIVPLTAEEKEQISWDFDLHEYEKMFGAPPTGGEQIFTPLERAWTRPTFEVNGISGGYTGEGFKTVIPSKAYAKISCRLVPDQDPQKVGRLVADYLHEHAPKGTNVKVELHGYGKALHARPYTDISRAFSQAYTEVFDTPCQRIYSGGSIPIVSELAAACGGDVVLMGLGLASDNIHAPNEHFGIDRIEKGFLIIARALELLKK